MNETKDNPDTPNTVNIHLLSNDEGNVDDNNIYS